MGLIYSLIYMSALLPLLLFSTTPQARGPAVPGFVLAYNFG